MKTKINRLMLIVLFGFSLSAMAQEYSAIYVFGDSLSDNGNNQAVLSILPHTELPPPPLLYDSNSMTNATINLLDMTLDDSKVAVEVLAESLGSSLEPAIFGGTNYAFIGATARDIDPDSSNDYSLNDQINLFLYRQNGVVPNDALYVIFMGGNDVRDVVKNDLNAVLGTADGVNSRKIIYAAVKNIGKSVRSLIKLGARHIMVVNSPDIGKIPETGLLAQQIQFPLLPTLATWRTKQFNAQLYFEMMIVRWQTGVKITQFNLFSKLNRLIKNAEELGFTNNSDACFNLLSTQQFHDDCEFGFKAQQFVFFDEIHPSTTTHGFIGNEMMDKLADPYPAFAYAR